MTFDSNIYYGYIIKGDLQGTIAYVGQFPEMTALYRRFLAVFEQEQYIRYDADDDINKILTIYQRYYRDVFYLGISKEHAAEKLRVRLAALLDIAEESAELSDLEQNQLVEAFGNKGLHFMGGKTSGYYGPYVWRTTETVSYHVELPDGRKEYTIKLLDGFITRSWMDYLSFGEIGPGGWTDNDGYINCVKAAYDFDSESFRVSLLKHEAQHARDLERNKNISSEDLEYRAKLVELIYSDERNLLPEFFQEADASDRNNGHAMAAYRIVKGFADALGMDEIDEMEPAAIPIAQIQTVARMLFEKSYSISETDYTVINSIPTANTAL